MAGRSVISKTWSSLGRYYQVTAHLHQARACRRRVEVKLCVRKDTGGGDERVERMVQHEQLLSQS